jgi:hypothetical protein
MSGRNYRSCVIMCLRAWIMHSRLVSGPYAAPALAEISTLN